MHNNPFSFAKNKISTNSQYIRHQTQRKQYWKRFFSNKINIVWFSLFVLLVITLIISSFFIKNSPTKSIDSSTNLVNNLPSYLNETIRRDLNRGEELEFIRNIAQIEVINALKEHRNPIFYIIFDSAKHLGGDQTIHTDIVTLVYNPYKLIEAINHINLSSKIIIPNGLYLGTNNYGIDIFARSISSIWITITVIIAAIIINIFIGFNLALLNNFYTNNIFVKFIDKLVNSISVIPEIIWVFLLSIFIGTEWYSLFISLSLVCWISYYNFAKEEIKILLTKEFIIATMAIGTSKIRLAYVHIFKNLLPNFFILLVERFSINILIASSLAFLDFINETNNLNIGSILKEAIGLAPNNPSYLIIVSIYIIAFSLTLKLLSSSLSNSFNPKIN
ncbi:peptide ABC transporter permease [Metamycoplasma phocicerebrale]|uniref:Peptide ABC transporter permease n=1 Tax=Metamycoplasma phocicerebrale TaxID=142649 RepID=A0A3Q9V9Y6_9BACT|nr:peptide ABC transporter permease [Metamycoplasma phocicerebrale]AZZ65268.1 peptide ABC transporter permease [Metamycoplasma phocicerebrale]